MENEKAKRLKPNEIIKPGIFTIIDSMPACPDCYSVNIQAEVVKHGPKKTNAVHFTCKTCYCEWIVAPEDELSAQEFIKRENTTEAFPRPTKEQIFFEAVKGKKIRWTHKCWIENDNWFIPETLTHDGEMRGVDENGQEQFHSVSTGFGEGGKYYWEFYPEPEKQEPKSKELAEMAIEIYRHGSQFDIYMKSPLRCPECGTTRVMVDIGDYKTCECVACGCKWKTVFPNGAGTRLRTIE